MSRELKARSSPILVLCYVAIAVCILGFLGCSIMGLVDFRSEEQKEIDYRNELIESGLFKEAERVVSYIKEHPSNVLKINNIKSVTCIGTIKVGSTRAVVRIITNSDTCYYFRITQDLQVKTTVENQYTEFVIDGRFKRLDLEDKDLEILFEEVGK